jgi:hypothetical protein
MFLIQLFASRVSASEPDEVKRWEIVKEAVGD